MIACVLLGPEADGSKFENAQVAYQQGAGKAEVTDLMDGDEVRNKAGIEHHHVENVEQKA